MDQNTTIERIQSKNINVIGQIVPIELNKVKEYMEQSILLLGKVTNAMAYHRRYINISALGRAPQQSKEMLRKEVELFQQQDRNLFGKKFSKNLGSTLFRQPSHRSKPSDCFLKRVGKKQKLFPYGPSKTPRTSSGRMQNSSSKRIVLVRRGNNKVWVDINKTAAAIDKVKANKKKTLFNMSFSHVIPTSE